MAMRNILQRQSCVLQMVSNQVIRRPITLSSNFNKYNKHTVEAVIRWNQENDAIYGPRVPVSKTSSTTKTLENQPQKKKRGRPKKVKNETEPVNDVLSNSDIAADKSARIDGIPLFPLFPPEMREYYVRAPEVPDLYLPGHTERAAYHNPFYPSVGTVLSATMPPEARAALKRWRDKLVDELGEDGFNSHKKEIMARGVDFHLSVQQVMEGARRSDVAISAHTQGYWESAGHALDQVSDIRATEKTVLHRHLCYKGQYDCVARFRDQLVLIDWKTSKKTKADIRYTYDNPLQVAAYVGANNFSQDVDTIIDAALIVVCYEDGQPAHTHLLPRATLVDYWTRWLWRLHTYWADKLHLTAHKPGTKTAAPESN